MNGSRARYFIIWLVAVIFIALFVVVARVVDEEARLAAISGARARVASTADNAETSVNRFLLSIDVLLATVAAGDAPPIDRARTLGLLAKSQLAVRDLVLLTPSGDVVASAMPVTQRLGLQLPKGFLSEAQTGAAPTLAVSAPADNFATSETVIYFARRVSTADSRSWVAVASVPASQVQASLGDPRDGLTLTLQRYNGETLLAAPLRGVPASTRVSRTPLRPSPDGQADLAKSDFDGRDAVIAARALVHPGLLVCVSAPQDAVLEGWAATRRTIEIAVAVLAMLVVAVAGLAHWILLGLQRFTTEVSKAKQWLDQAIGSVPEGILLCDSQERVVAWNAKYLDFYPWLRPAIRQGIPHEQLVRISVKNLFPASSPEEQADLVRQRLAVHRGTGAEFDHQIGDEITVQITERRTPAGGTVSVFRDVTDSERALKAAHRATQAARGSSERFVAGIRDELHDSAASALSLMERARGNDDASQAKASIDASRLEVQQLASDITDLYELFLLEDGAVQAREAFALMPLLQHSCQHAEELARGKRVSLLLRFPQGAPESVVGDARRLSQLTYSTLRAVVSASPSQTDLVAEWSCAPGAPEPNPHLQLRLEISAQDAVHASSAVEAMMSTNRMKGRPRTAIRLARRIADVLDGELIVGDTATSTGRRVILLTLRVGFVKSEAEVNA